MGLSLWKFEVVGFIFWGGISWGWNGSSKGESGWRWGYTSLVNCYLIDEWMSVVDVIVFEFLFVYLYICIFGDSNIYFIGLL